jgi:hypothetical protein
MPWIKASSLASGLIIQRDDGGRVIGGHDLLCKGALPDLSGAQHKHHPAVTERLDDERAGVTFDQHRSCCECGGIDIAYAERTPCICGVLPAKPKDETTLGLAAARLTFHAVRDGVFVHEQGLCESESVRIAPPIAPEVRQARDEGVQNRPSPAG